MKREIVPFTPDAAVEWPSNPGDYYDHKRTELRAALDAVAAARERAAGPEEIRRLERAAEQAAYVGD